eukprot:863392-Alexandrium_andersonii.AAC.1
MAHWSVRSTPQAVSSLRGVLLSQRCSLELCDDATVFSSSSALTCNAAANDFSGLLKDTIFFQVVRCSPNQLHVASVDGQKAFQRFDVAIRVSTVVGVDSQ